MSGVRTEVQGHHYPSFPGLLYGLHYRQEVPKRQQLSRIGIFIRPLSKCTLCTVSQKFITEEDDGGQQF